MNNPPAFPAVGEAIGEIDGIKVKYPHRAEGMTLRDYFASHAPPMPERWHEMAAGNSTYVDDLTGMCLWRFQYADAMLKERERQ